MKRDRLRQYQRRLAPGTPLRAGLDRILHGRTGALVVLGNNAKVQQVSTGGFQLNVDFTPQALRELAKLDGAIILSNDLSRIIAAGVHLVPAGDLPTAETGTRHRSADRTAQASGVPVVTVSASMSTISLFMDGDRHPVETSGQMISRANQTLATLARFVDRLGDILHQFNALEVGEQVTIRSLVLVAQRFEMTRRLSAETQFHIDTLGVEGVSSPCSMRSWWASSPAWTASWRPTTPTTSPPRPISPWNRCTASLPRSCSALSSWRNASGSGTRPTLRPPSTAAAHAC